MKTFVEFKVSFFSLTILDTVSFGCPLLCLDIKKCAEEHKVGGFTIVMCYA